MRKLMTMMLWALPLSVLAQETMPAAQSESLLRRPLSAQDPLPLEPVGSATRSWTELQISNSAASPVARPLTGEVADKIYQRYLDSYTKPIPQTFPRDNFTTGSGSGSSSR